MTSVVHEYSEICDKIYSLMLASEEYAKREVMDEPNVSKLYIKAMQAMINAHRDLLCSIALLYRRINELET